MADDSLNDSVNDSIVEGDEFGEVALRMNALNIEYHNYLIY